MSDVLHMTAPRFPLARRLVEAGLALCVVGLLWHRMWNALPAGRFAESLALAAAWALVAAGLCRLRPMRMAGAIAACGVVFLVLMAGPLPVLAALVLAAGAVAIGTWFARDAALAFVIGAGLVAGVAGWLLRWPVHHAWTWSPVLVAIVILRRREVLATLDAARADWNAAVEAAPRTAAWSMLAIGLASAPGWLPTMQYDDVAYHLGLPWQLMRSGRYAPDVGSQVWSVAPWAGDVLHGIAQVVARQEARGPLNVVWLVASVALCGRVAGALGAPVALRWVAGALVATLPPVAALVGGMQTELPAMAAMLAALALATQPGRRAVPALGVLAGFLLGLKALHPFAAAALFFFALQRNARDAGWATTVGAALLALLVGASSYASAWALCGNPVLPLLNEVFRSPCYAPLAFSDDRWHSIPGVPLPWSMTFMTSRHMEGFDGGLGIMLIALSGAAVVAVADARTRWPAVAALAAILVPMGVLPYARYVVPGIALLLPVAVATLARLYPPRAALAILVAISGLNLAFQTNAQWMLHTGAVKRAVGALGRDEPLLARYLPERLLLARVRDAWPHARVLDLGAATHAELAGRGTTSTWYAPKLHAQGRLADRDPSGAAWARLLREQGIDVVLLRSPDATPARRAGLARAGAHRVMTIDPVECWRLPPREPR